MCAQDELLSIRTQSISGCFYAMSVVVAAGRRGGLDRTRVSHEIALFVLHRSRAVAMCSLTPDVDIS